MLLRELAERRVTGSPGSGEWREFLCVYQNGEQVEIAISGFEIGEDGVETNDFGPDPNYVPVGIAELTQNEIDRACRILGWDSDHARV